MPQNSSESETSENYLERNPICANHKWLLTCAVVVFEINQIPHGNTQQRYVFGVCTKKLIFSTKTYVVGTQKNHLNKTVLLSTQNICSNWLIRIYSQFYTQNFCLSKPMYIIWTICCSYPKLKMQKRVILNKYTELKIEGHWSRMSILSNRLLKNYRSINQSTENDQRSMNPINRPTTTIECTYTSTSIHCTVTIDFYTTGLVPSGAVLSVLPMVCLYRLKNCCLKMWQCKSLCTLLLLLTALWLYCLASSQLFHSTQHKFICKSQLITGYFLSTEAGPGGGDFVWFDSLRPINNLSVI